MGNVPKLQKNADESPHSIRPKQHFPEPFGMETPGAESTERAGQGAVCV